jgi:hypothetical protein
MPITTGLKKAQKKRSELYKFAKRNKLNVDWKSTTYRMEKAVNAFKQTKGKTIMKTFRMAKQNNDQAALKAINTTTGKFDIPLSRFNRIRKNIVSPADKKLLIHFKDSDGSIVKTYHLHDRLININNLFIDQENQYSSGADVDLNILPSTTIATEWLPNPPRSRSERKNFFRYLLKSVSYDLEAFQVYSIEEAGLIPSESEDSFDPEIHSDRDAVNYPCFLFALYKAGVVPKIVKQISQTMFNSGATIDFIRKTANAFALHISVKQYKLDKDGFANNKITHYGSKSLNEFQLGSVGEHLFAIKPTKITKAALDNPTLVEEHGRTDFIIKDGRASFNSKRIKFLNSYEVISYLFHHRETLLETITQQNMPFLLNNKYQEVRSLNAEDFDDANFRQMGIKGDGDLKLGQAPFKGFNSKEKKYYERTKYNVIYFDFETLLKGNIHVPYCVSYCIAEVNTRSDFKKPTFSETKNIYGFGCEKLFLEALPEKSYNLLWAHNAGFDCRFLLKHMTFSSKNTNMIDCGTKLKQTQGFYNGREIVIKDTMSFLAERLSELPEMFKGATESLSLEKECFPHNLINEHNYQSLWDLEYLDSYKYKDILLANAAKIGAIKDDEFDCQMYATHYCNRDVDVLNVCFEAFRKLVFDEFKLDIYRFLSVSSLSLAYQHNKGCFDGCYEMNSVLLGFIREATVGGRVMTRDNEKHHIKHKLADFDAVSLYPSAMSELKGYVRGKAKMFKNVVPSDADYFIARVRFDSIGKKRHFPLQSYFENNSRKFTNDIVGRLDEVEGSQNPRAQTPERTARTMILGKQALDDMVQFQNATYTVIEGCYWNEGFNDQIVKTIGKMFNDRLKYKAKKNPLQKVLKLMMNSSYGKLLMKPIVKKKVIVSGGEKKIDDYTRKNIHRMISRTPISDNLAMFEEHKALSQHFAAVHLGVQILDSSKHIMNRVMCMAEDIDAKIWYQDTDSMMIDYDAVPRLADAYKQIYNKELIGEKMGQFHVDFELEGSKGNIYAKESIFLGKKSYLAVLACDGNDVEGFHIRMKGIPSKLLEENVYEKYMSLLNGKSLSFDLSELCPIQINTKTQTVSKRSNFTRNVSF